MSLLLDVLAWLLVGAFCITMVAGLRLAFAEGTRDGGLFSMVVLGIACIAGLAWAIGRVFG